MLLSSFDVFKVSAVLCCGHKYRTLQVTRWVRRAAASKTLTLAVTAGSEVKLQREIRFRRCMLYLPLSGTPPCPVNHSALCDVM